MAETGNQRENLIKLRDELAEIDPEVAEIDLDDPDMAFALVILAAALKGGSVSIESGEDGERTETLTIAGISGVDEAQGQPVLAVTVSSSDGMLSPQGAEATASLLSALSPDFDSELNALLGE